MTHLDGRVLELLERLFALGPLPMDVVLSQSSDLIAQITRCEKVDTFLCDVGTRTLVAVGTSRTELGHLQKRLGLDRLPLANADPMSQVFETGEAYHNGHVEKDSRQPRGIVEGMGVRSMLAVAFEVDGERRGVISLASRRPNAFSDADLMLLKMVAVWIGNLVHRSELIDAFTKQASEHTRRAAAEELITVLAHDLRNLLSPITARLALLHERARAEEREQDASDCERSLAGIARLNAIMSDLLDVARIEQGVSLLNYESFDLVKLVRESALALARPDVDVTVASYIEPLTLSADRNRLWQALENVLSNAIKHSPKGAPVHVELASTVHEDRPAVRISVIDQGPGIAPELLPRVFERYVRGGGAPGLGLGLYLARSTVIAHGGTIMIGPSAGQGTRCELVLPLEQEPSRETQSNT